MSESNRKLVIMQLAWFIHPALGYWHINIARDRGRCPLYCAHCTGVLYRVMCRQCRHHRHCTAHCTHSTGVHSPVPPFSWRWSGGAGWSPEQTGKHETINIELVRVERTAGLVQCRGGQTFFNLKMQAFDEVCEWLGSGFIICRSFGVTFIASGVT